jgi:hypothetical protein
LELTRARKADVFKHVLLASLQPSDFEWYSVVYGQAIAEIARVTDDKLVHKSTGFSFRFSSVGGTGFKGEWQPPDETNHTSRLSDTWPDHLKIFDKWLLSVFAEVETPDVWLHKWKRVGLRSTTAAMPMRRTFRSPRRSAR